MTVHDPAHDDGRDLTDFIETVLPTQSKYLNTPYMK